MSEMKEAIYRTEWLRYKDAYEKLEKRIAAAKEALDDYCDGCSRFTEKTFVCTLKNASSCPILKVRLCLSQEQKGET